MLIEQLAGHTDAEERIAIIEDYKSEIFNTIDETKIIDLVDQFIHENYASLVLGPDKEDAMTK